MRTHPTAFSHVSRAESYVSSLSWSLPPPTPLSPHTYPPIPPPLTPYPPLPPQVIVVGRKSSDELDSLVGVQVITGVMTPTGPTPSLVTEVSVEN